MKFTPRSIEALKPESKRYIVWKENGDGLGIRITPNGKKSFVFMYRFGGKPRMMTLGVFPRVKLADAGVLHSAAKKLFDEGVDPAAIKQKHKKNEKEADTISGLIEAFIEWGKKNKKSWKEDERMLQKNVEHVTGKKKVKDINKKDILSMLDTIIARGSPVQANRVLGCLRKMFNFAVERDIIQISPCYGMKAPAKEQQRDRVLTQEEIKTFWQGMDNENVCMTKEVKIALKLVLVTAQRKGEVLHAEWSEIDLENGWWVIPKEKSKNGLSHRVPLSKQALELLSELKESTGGRDLLFPARHGQEGSLNQWALSSALYKNFKHIGVEEKFTTHDLRRTGASHITGMGISRLVVSKILNHVERSITAVYDRYSYDKEKRHALDAWGNEIDKIIYDKKSSNVVAISA